MLETRPVFDGHAHVFVTNLTLASDRSYTPDHNASIKQYISLLKQNRLEGALLVQPSFLGHDNSYLIEALHQFRGNGLKGWGTVMLHPQTSFKIMQKLQQQGIIGIRLNYFNAKDADIKLLDFNDSSWMSFFKKINQLNWHVELYLPKNNYTSFIERLRPHVRQIVLDHFALAEAIPDALLRPSPDSEVFVKCSGPYRALSAMPTKEAVYQCRAIAHKFAKLIGTERLIWGSDWPWTRTKTDFTYADTLNWWQTWNKDNSTHQWSNLLIKQGLSN